MKEFVFYTPDGYTQSPCGSDVENFQILGFAKGETAKSALNNLIKQNDWIINYGFNISKIVGVQILNDC